MLDTDVGNHNNHNESLEGSGEIDTTKQSSQNSKSTIYVAVPAKENKKVKCPHCNHKIQLTRRDSIITCPNCFEYMHVVYIKKSDDEKKKSTKNLII